MDHRKEGRCYRLWLREHKSLDKNLKVCVDIGEHIGMIMSDHDSSLLILLSAVSCINEFRIVVLLLLLLLLRIKGPICFDLKKYMNCSFWYDEYAYTL